MCLSSRRLIFGFNHYNIREIKLPLKDLEKRREYMKGWRAEHPEYKIRARVREKEYRNRPENKERYKKWRKEHKKKHVEYCREWRKQLKLKLIQIFGGKCQRCGYNKYFGSLDFHHKTGEKEKNWEWRTKGFIEKIKSGKIELLCANCHREKHAEENFNGNLSNM